MASYQSMRMASQAKDNEEKKVQERKKALDEFKELSTVEPLRLIEKGGMSVLLALLRTDDTQLTRDSLETLTNLLDTEVPKGMAEAAQVAAMHNAGIFLTNATNVGVVLNAIDGEENDMYVRFYAVQLLMKLLAVAPAQTQDAVLSQPVVVSRVMQLMEDRREIVRNEVLLLLAELSKGNADLQNILAFQGAFDQLLGIVESEGKEESAHLATPCRTTVRITPLNVHVRTRARRRSWQRDRA